MFLLTTPPYLKLKFFLFPLFTLLRESNKYLRLLDYIQPLILKILHFLKNNLKKEKPLSKMPKG
jgi:hypothetical protein